MDHTKKNWGLFSLLKLEYSGDEHHHHRWEDLPEGIIDHIQSFLPAGDAVRSSLCCKSWLHAYSTSPTLNFQQHPFLDDMRNNGWKIDDWMQKFAELFTKICSSRTRGATIDDDGMQKFAEYLGNTLSRYHQHGLPIQTLHLSLTRLGWEDRELVSLVQRSFDIAKESGLVNLYVRMSGSLGNLTVPLEIFSCKTLQQVKLYCWLGRISLKSTSTSRANYNRDSIMMIRCHSLRKLELRGVYIPEEVISGLFSACPLIEDIVLHECSGFRNLMVSGDVLRHLRSFEIMTYGGSTDEQTVDIADPSTTLRTFKFAGPYRCFPVPPLITPGFKIGASPNLTTLCLRLIVVMNSEFSRLISGFPLLEDLCIESLDSLVEIDIKSDYLQKLKIVCCKDLRQVKLDAPNLVVLSFNGDDANIVAGLSLRGITRPQVKSDLALRVVDYRRFDHSLLLQLRKVLEISHEARLSIKLRSRQISPDINLDVLRGKPPLCSNVVETLLLNCRPSSCPDTHSTIMDAFFSIFRPKYLCLTYDWDFRNDGFFRFVCEQLTEKTYPLRCFCGSSTDSRDDDQKIFRCWRHHLNGVQQIDYFHVPYSAQDYPCYKPIEVPWRSLFDGSIRIKKCSHIRLTLDWS